MIIVISGGVGSGKTLTAVRLAVEESKTNKVLTNFKLQKVKNYKRLKKTDVILDVSTDPRKKEYDINWQFWNQHRSCDVFIDEVHEIVNSRRAMSKENQAYSNWVAQIRKLWGEQGDQNHLDTLSRMNNDAFHKYHKRFISKSNNLYLITQRTRKMDVNFRDLAHVYIQCQKQIVKKDGKKLVLIFNNYWFGDDNCDAIEYSQLGVKPKRTYFVGNKYFPYYDSYEIIGRKESEYL